MQELLTGKKRLPGFNGEWKVMRLEELGSIYGGLTGKSKVDFGTAYRANPIVSGSLRYWIRLFMNIMANVVIDCALFEYVDVKSTESQNNALDMSLS